MSAHAACTDQSIPDTIGQEQQPAFVVLAHPQVLVHYHGCSLKIKEQRVFEGVQGGHLSMWEKNQGLGDAAFVEELRSALLNGVLVAEVVAKFNVDFEDVEDWLKGDGLPPSSEQLEILKWLDTQLETQID